MRRILVVGVCAAVACAGSVTASPSAEASVSALSGSGPVMGDFDGDGFADLAIRVPGEDGSGDDFRGEVNVIYGAAGGLTEAGDQLWSQDSPGIKEVAELGDDFGTSLAVADFDGDGFDDLAVGVPVESVAAVRIAGGVNVIYGSAGGLTEAGDQFWSQDSPGIKEVAEFGDFLGTSLAAADFGKGPHADLAVGAPLESATLDASGGVNVIYGSAGGLTEVGDQFWTQDSPGIQEAAEPSDSFGRSLAAADFGKSIHADLAVGVPGESFAGIPEGGGVNVIYGTAGGLTEAGDQFWSQDSPGVKGVAKPFDHFGRALSSVAVGNGAGS